MCSACLTTHLPPTGKACRKHMATDSQQVVSPEGLEGGQSVPLPSDNGPEWTPEVGQPAIADLQRIPLVSEVGQHATADPQNEIQVSQHAAEPVPSTSTGGATPSGLNFTELTRVINDQSGRMELLTGQIASITNALGQLRQRAQSVPPHQVNQVLTVLLNFCSVLHSSKGSKPPVLRGQLRTHRLIKFDSHRQARAVLWGVRLYCQVPAKQ